MGKEWGNESAPRGAHWHYICPFGNSLPYRCRVPGRGQQGLLTAPICQPSLVSFPFLPMDHECPQSLPPASRNPPPTYIVSPQCCRSPGGLCHHHARGVFSSPVLCRDAALQRMEDSANLLEALCWPLPEAISSSELLASWLLFPNSPLCLAVAPIPTPHQLSTFFFHPWFTCDHPWFTRGYLWFTCDHSWFIRDHPWFTRDHFARVSQFLLLHLPES